MRTATLALLAAAAMAPAHARAHADAEPERGADVRDDTAPPPPGTIRRGDDGPRHARPGHLFVNMDGGYINRAGYNQDDSRTNSSYLVNLFPTLEGEWPAYGNGSRRSAVMQAVRNDWRAFDMNVVEERPTQGDYSMVMVGPKQFQDGGQGYSPIDCRDSNHNNIAFLYTWDTDNALGANETAGLISHEASHGFGLEHTEGQGHMMRSFLVGDPSFQDDCRPLEVSYNECDAQHRDHCNNGYSNEYAELMTLFGPAVPDTAPPWVEITAPADGSVFPAGSSFAITAEAGDDRFVEATRLFVDGTYVAPDNSVPYAWNADDPPVGTMELTVIALDAAGNEGMSNVVRVTVEDASDDDDSGTDGGDDTDTGMDGDEGADEDDGSGTSGEDAPDGDTGALPPGGPPVDGDDDSGCACSSRGGDSSGLLFGLGLMGLATRRRR